jgi:hypothetical protein
MAIIVRDKHNYYLGSPHKFGDGDECWIWLGNRNNAHQFPSRGEAKKTLRTLDPRYTMNQFNFEKV